jgi:hypothetical protein
VRVTVSPATIKSPGFRRQILMLAFIRGYNWLTLRPLFSCLHGDRGSRGHSGGSAIFEKPDLQPGAAIWVKGIVISSG